MATVELQTLSKRFSEGSGGLSGLDLTIQSGELLTLVGPSGCGKSTTLNLIAGLEQPSSGRVLIDGRDVTALPPGDRDIAMVFQSYALYPHLSVRQNLEFPLRIRKLDSTQMNQRVEETAERLGLGPLLERKPGALSGGQRQRVALGRALVRRAKLYLFDEPLSNLDAALRAQTRVEIKRLHAELKATFIYVTHDQAEAMTLSDRVAVLKDGALQQLAPPREVYDRPANTFVAGFIGSPAANLLPASAWPPAQRSSGTLAIRPEHLELLRFRSTDTVEGKIYVLEPVGAETWVTVALNGQPGHRVVARAPADFKGELGQPIWLRANPDRLVAFPEG